MRSIEAGVLKDSDYYLYTPSTQALKTFFYPICTGFFRYAPGYCLKRSTYDSFLIMYVKKGACTVSLNGQTWNAGENQIVVLDCYKPHSYYTSNGWDALWLHFDGPVAREYFQLITADSGPVITLKDNFIFEKYLSRVYQLFRDNAAIKESLVSQYITNVLTELLVSQDSRSGGAVQAEVIEETTAYMSEHMTEPLTLEQLAARASLSPYYFTRLFKKETGFTPHEYLIAIRINAAKFLLKNTPASIKEICFRTGFGNESSFCTTFKKWVGATPSEYRVSSIPDAQSLPAASAPDISE